MYSGYERQPSDATLPNLYRSIELHREALTALDVKTAPSAWATGMHSLGNALRLVPGDHVANLERAVSCYDAALSVFTKRDFPAQWAATMTNLGIVWSLLGALDSSDRQTEKLNRAISCLQAALTVRSEAATPGPWSLTQHNLGNAYLRLAQAGDQDATAQGILAYQAALRVRTRQTAPLQWARTIRSLAAVRLHLTDPIRAKHLPAAIQDANDALTVLTREDTPADWSGAHLTLANANILLATGDRNENLENAIAHFDAALPLMTGAESGAEFLRAKATLADALLDVERGDRKRNALRAIALYREWLTNAGAKESDQRAGTLDRLGGAYQAVGDLESAASSYEQALALLADGSEAWARHQRRLGDVLSEIGLRGSPNNLERAVACYQAALRLYSETAFPEEWAAVQINMGRCIAANTGPQREAALWRAIGCYEGALRKVTQKLHPDMWATAQLNLGNALARLGGPKNLSRAIGYFESAMRVNTEDRSPVRWAGIQNSLGTAYRKLSAGDRSTNLKRAASCFESALRVLSETDTPEDWARTQANLGNVYWDAAKLEGAPAARSAAACYEKALHILTKERNRIDWAKITSELGVVYASLAGTGEEARRAIETCAASLTVLTRSDYPMDWALAQYHLGSCYLHLATGNREENIQAALSCFGLAATILDSTGSPLHWTALKMDSGSAYAQLQSGDREHNLGQALACFGATLAVYSEREYPAEWAAAQANIGAVQIELERMGVVGATAEGVKALESALRVLTPDSNPTQWAQGQINLGTALGKQDPERAHQCYERALGVLSAANQPGLWAMTLGLLGGSYATRSDELEDQQRAIECFERQLSVMTPESNPWGCLKATEQLAVTHYFGRQWSQAVMRYLEAASLAERLRSVSGDDSTRLGVLRKALSVFDRGMLAAAQAQQYERALEFAERGKARNLADQLRRADYQPRSAGAEDWRRYQDVLREIAAARTATTGEIFDQSAATSYEATLARLFGLRQEAAELEKRFKEADPEYALFDQPLDSTRVLALAKLLDAVIIDFRLTSEGSYAFLAGPDDVFTAENAVPLDLVVKEGSVHWPGEFSGVISPEDIESSRGEELAHDMYKLVMAPIRQRLRERYPAAKRLVLIPSRGLALLPLQAAQIETENGSSYLLDEYEIAWAPNCLILERCAMRGVTAPAAIPSLMAVQNPDRSLPFADWEVEEIKSLFPAELRRVFAGAKATRSAVGQSLSFGAERLFSCHAAFDTAKPERSHLRLVDGILTLSDLLRADFRNASLVVMSACTSGIVDLQMLDVDEHFGLATACLVSGAQTVVASLWKVNDVATALLMQRFHRNLYTSGMDRAPALQEAQIWLRDMEAEEAFAILEMRQADCEDDQAAADAAQALLDLRDRGPKPFAHPYWWAAFQCIGSGWAQTAPQAGDGGKVRP